VLANNSKDIIESLLHCIYEGTGSPYAGFATEKENVIYSGKERGITMSWFVYMLRCRDGSLYTGYTDDIERRFSVHQSGKGAKYTRSRLPVELAYQEILPDKSAALKREAAIKKLSRQQKLQLIEEAVEKRSL
jgi:putative endonuclease